MDVENSVSGHTGGRYTDLDGSADATSDKDPLESTEPLSYLDSGHRSLVYEDNEEDQKRNFNPVHYTQSFGRDRRGMYVPAYERGPTLDDSADELSPSRDDDLDSRILADCDTLPAAGDSKNRSDRPVLRFEKVFSSPSVVVSPHSMFQAERAETEVISSPLPRQLVLKSGSKSFDQESPSPLTSSSSLTSPVVERGESVVSEPYKRSEITVKPKNCNNKIDGSHGSKYQTLSSASTIEGDKVGAGRTPASRSGGRPSRRTRNVPVVNAKVSYTPEIIQAEVIEVNERERSLTDDVVLIADLDPRNVAKLKKLESIILNNSEIPRRTVALEDEHFQSAQEQHEDRTGAADIGSDDEQFEKQEEEEVPLAKDINLAENPAPSASSIDKDLEIVEELEVENEGTVDQIEDPLEFDRVLAIVAAATASVYSDNEGAPLSEDTSTSTLQRRGSIHPHQRKTKDGRRKAASSRSPIQPFERSGLVLPPDETETIRAKRIKFADCSSASEMTKSSLRNEVISAVKIESKDSLRGKTQGIDKLRKKTSSVTGVRGTITTAEPGHVRTPEFLQDCQYERHSVLLRRDAKGYGMTMGGSSPVTVLAVRENGVAERYGIRPNDELVKINGTYVHDKSHEEVVGLIKSAGNHLDLSLMRPVLTVTKHPLNDEYSLSTMQSLSQSSSLPRPKQTHSLKENMQRNTIDKNYQQKKNQNQSFSSVKKKGDRDDEPMRFQGEILLGGRKDLVQPGGNSSAEKQNSRNRELFSAQSTGSLKFRGAVVPESKGLSQLQGGGNGGSSSVGFSIIGTEDDEEDLPIDPVFSDLTILKQHIGHLAVFLKFLISVSDPAPMLFSMITDYYHAAMKETGSGTRWAFEIYTTFLVTEAPLKLSVGDGMVSSIENVLRNTKDLELRTVFRPVENFVRETILVKKLKDLCKDISIGLGPNYGAHDLKSNLDRSSELRIIDSNLTSHFETYLANELSDSDQALAFSLATFFRQVGFNGGKNSSLLDTCPSFIFKDKDKKILKYYKLKKNYESKGHFFIPHRCTSVTKCQNCERMIWGIGFQAYQCSSCELIVHRLCADGVWQLCSGTARRAKDPRRVVGRAIGSSRNKTVLVKEDGSKSIFHIPTDEATPTTTGDKPSADVKATSGEKVSDVSDADQQSESDSELNRRPSSWPHTTNNSVPEVSLPLPKISSNIPSSRLSDSDFEIEPELPPLSQVLSKEAIKKLKGKERKKQEYINELFYTERTHLRSLKVIDRFFRQPIATATAEDPALKKDFSLIFSNLLEVIQLHNDLNKEFKKLRQNNEIVNDIGGILVSRFSGVKGLQFQRATSKFCQDQLYTLGILKIRQKENPKLAQILQEATLNGYCGRQELKDLLPREMQRLTKYPLLIENIRNCTPADTPEYENLVSALKLSKDLLEHVNHAVRDCENYRRTQDMQSRLDRRPIENSSLPVLIEYKNLNLTQHKMIYDGELNWRRPQQRLVELHVALFEHFIVLLHKQDDRLVLRCQNTTIEDVTFLCSPISKLEHLLTKDVAVDKRAFFLINKSADAPQVYELVAKSKEEKNRWCGCIKETVEKYHKQYSNEPTPHRPPLIRSDLNVAISDSIDSGQGTNQVDGDLNQSAEEFQAEQTAKEIPVLYQTLSPDVVLRENFTVETDNASSLLPELQEKESIISDALCDKVKLLADQLHIPCFSDDFTSEELGIDERNMSIEDLIKLCLNVNQRLSELGRGRLGAQRSEESTAVDSDRVHALPLAAEEGDDETVMISATELIRTNQKLQRLLNILAVRAEMDAESPVQSRLSAWLAMATDEKSIPVQTDARKPVLRPTSYMAALKRPDVGGRSLSDIQLLRPDGRNISDDNHLAPSENGTLSAGGDSFATKDISFV